MQTFPAGWYGKMPGTGDFVARRMPAAFSEAWDRWLQAAIAGSRERLGADWREAYLSMPVWRFVLSPGLLTAQAWAGIVAPSVDAVGRHFPLAIAAALPPTSLDLVRTLVAAATWFDEIESIALDALSPGADVPRIDAAVAQKPFRAEWLRPVEGSGDETVPIRGHKTQMLSVLLPARNTGWEKEMLEAAPRFGEPWGAWLAEESELFGRCLLLCEALPQAEHFCAMMDGRWDEHGWSRRDVRSGATA